MRASMPLTHQYLLNIVEEAGGLNEERLAWFYQRYIKSEQVKYTPELASVIKQLHYLGKIEKRGSASEISPITPDSLDLSMVFT